MNPTEAIASFVVEAEFNDFPHEIVLQAKNCILDSIGCALGGVQTELGQQYIRIAKELGGNPEATVIGDGARVSCMNAAYTNALLCVALDFCDTHLYAISHPGGPTIQSAFPAAETVRASGKDLITAVILGYEVCLRIGHAIRTIVTDGWQSGVLYNDSFTVFGSVTSAGKLLGLNKEEMISALGLAGALVQGTPKGTIRSRAGVMARLGEAKLDYQMKAFLGTLAAWQAKKGLKGPKGILDEDFFWTKSGAGSCDFLELTRYLGEKYRIMEVGFKFACSCRHTHSAITAVRKAVEGEDIKAEDIEEIVLRQAVLLPLLYEWDNMLEAQFSLPCAVAMSIAGGEPGPSWYKTDRFKAPDIYELAKKIRFIDDREARKLWVKYGKQVSTAEVKTIDGRIRKAYIEYPRGEPENPISAKDFQRKFMSNAVGTLMQRQAEELRYLLLHLEEVNDVSALTRLLHSHESVVTSIPDKLESM